MIGESKTNIIITQIKTTLKRIVNILKQYSFLILFLFILFIYLSLSNIFIYFIDSRFRNKKMSTPTEERISENAKVILLSLFGLIGTIIALGTYVIVAKPEIPVELLTLIFGSAITGAFTLAGTLIQTLWGK